MDKSSKEKSERETAGGFNPDRPNKSPKKTVGPLPTDDPHGRAGEASNDELEKRVQPKE